MIPAASYGSMNNIVPKDVCEGWIKQFLAMDLEALKEELAVPPMPETNELYRQILENRVQFSQP